MVFPSVSLLLTQNKSNRAQEKESSNQCHAAPKWRGNCSVVNDLS